MSAMAYRMAATDLDGTLIRTDGAVSRRTCAAMRARALATRAALISEHLE